MVESRQRLNTEILSEAQNDELKEGQNDELKTGNGEMR
jgi:hypothetical protein